MDLGVEVVLLSGDHRATVESLARHLDVDNVRAELTPKERGEEVRRLVDAGGLVCVVGRLGHDDAALNEAHVPVALGAAGAPGGEKGIAVATTDMRDAAAALFIARAARTWRTRALFLSGALGALLVGGAVVGLLTPWLAAVLAAAVDVFALPSGARLLRRIDLRLPIRE
jgi:P-type E1-E2 ATPase